MRITRISYSTCCFWITCHFEQTHNMYGANKKHTVFPIFLNCNFYSQKLYSDQGIVKLSRFSPLHHIGQPLLHPVLRATLLWWVQKLLLALCVVQGIALGV
ncbi:hypothetical protein QL285_001774 [Trifolium repens]|nr:hypothetical protein QL285_001774 [Trifolium repens]